MLAAYACRTGVALCAGKSVVSKATVLFSKQNVYTGIAFRQASNQTRSSFTRRAAKSRSLKEIVMSPAGEGGMPLCIIELIHFQALLVHKLIIGCVKFQPLVLVKELYWVHLALVLEPFVSTVWVSLLFLELLIDLCKY